MGLRCGEYFLEVAERRNTEFLLCRSRIQDDPSFRNPKISNHSHINRQLTDISYPKTQKYPLQPIKIPIIFVNLQQITKSPLNKNLNKNPQPTKIPNKNSHRCYA